MMDAVEWRVHSWFCAGELRELYGIQVKVRDNKKWLHVCSDGEPLLFQYREDAVKAAAELLSKSLRKTGGDE
jgi:hypothetical protein